MGGGYFYLCLTHFVNGWRVLLSMSDPFTKWVEALFFEAVLHLTCHAGGRDAAGHLGAPASLLAGTAASVPPHRRIATPAAGTPPGQPARRPALHKPAVHGAPASLLAGAAASVPPHRSHHHAGGRDAAGPAGTEAGAPEIDRASWSASVPAGWRGGLRAAASIARRSRCIAKRKDVSSRKRRTNRCWTATGHPAFPPSSTMSVT